MLNELNFKIFDRLTKRQIGTEALDSIPARLNSLANVAGQMARLNYVVRTHNLKPLDNIFKFADIAGEIVVLQ